VVVQTHDLWRLVSGKPQIDPDDLAAAVEAQAGDPDLDYRTKLLIRDSTAALGAYWGREKLQRWLARAPLRERIEAICQESLERPGFPSIGRRLMKKTDPEDIRTLFRELGQRLRLRKPLTVHIAGSVALLLRDLLSRSTEDIDFINEVPAEIRSEHRLLDELKGRYGLALGHVQSHYFPSGWESRARYLDTFGDLRVYLVDAIDVFLSKLCSARTKDLDDLRMLVPQLDKDTLTRRLKETTAGLYAPEDLRKRAADNWYILYGEPLPQ
jgi:hypothetical protein